MKKTTFKLNKGFTLFEVMIALAIVAIALAALVQAARANANNAAYLRDKTFAQWVAVNKMTEWRVNKDWLNTGEQKGHDLMGGNDWYWSAKISSETLDKNIRKVDFTVYRTEDDRIQGKAHVFRMYNFIVNPK